MKKKAFVFLICTWMSSFAWGGERIEVNGIYYLFHGDSATVTYTGVLKLGNYTIPKSDYIGTIIVPDSVLYEDNWYHVTEVGDNAFQESHVAEVVLPESETKIGIRYADTYMVAVADKTQNSYTIQEGTKWIGDAAFEDFSSATSITLPSSKRASPHPT